MRSSTGYGNKKESHCELVEAIFFAVILIATAYGLAMTHRRHPEGIEGTEKKACEAVHYDN
jgi:hypothetical protein